MDQGQVIQVRDASEAGAAWSGSDRQRAEMG